MIWCSTLAFLSFVTSWFILWFFGSLCLCSESFAPPRLSGAGETPTGQTVQHRIGAHRGLDRGVLAVVLEEDMGGGGVEVVVGDHWLAGVAPCPSRWPYSEF